MLKKKLKLYEYEIIFSLAQRIKNQKIIAFFKPLLQYITKMGGLILHFKQSKKKYRFFNRYLLRKHKKYLLYKTIARNFYYTMRLKVTPKVIKGFLYNLRLRKITNLIFCIRHSVNAFGKLRFKNSFVKQHGFSHNVANNLGTPYLKFKAGKTSISKLFKKEQKKIKNNSFLKLKKVKRLFVLKRKNTSVINKDFAIQKEFLNANKRIINKKHKAKIRRKSFMFGAFFNSIKNSQSIKFPLKFLNQPIKNLKSKNVLLKT